MRLIIILFIAFNCNAQIPDKFFRALNMAETGGRTGAIRGRNGELGPLQITYAYWHDSGVKGKFNDCTNYNYSCKVVKSYLQIHANKYIIKNDYEALARAHNSGPLWYTKKYKTDKYWNKVRSHLK